MTEEYEIKPDVLTADDIMHMVPKLAGHPKLVNHLMHWLKVDKMNWIHRQTYDTPGPRCATRMLSEALGIKLQVDNAQVLDHLPDGAFITVSNHPYGALDGIALISLIGERRPEFKVMVNMILNHITALRPNFIAVDAWAQQEASKKAVSINGIRACLRQIREGKPLGFFPAGAMSKVNWKWQQIDRPWQESVLQLIYRSNVPVIPIYFHGGNSFLCNVMGHLCWPVRSIMLPGEVMKKRGKTIRVTIGDPISVEEQAAHRQSPDTLGAFLRKKTYELKNPIK